MLSKSQSYTSSVCMCVSNGIKYASKMNIARLPIHHVPCTLRATRTNNNNNHMRAF